MGAVSVLQDEEGLEHCCTTACTGLALPDCTFKSGSFQCCVYFSTVKS